ncbi:NAD-dependent epimerase/dehydratase family protein [Synechococcus sp. HB1133]|uniref:GDP-mannose 4,6-dehydratase n=1 Tax=unclassified Synechococcus TaxID=2626047 RepID=UPI00140C5F8E|nr:MULTISPECIES: GDP-mannose 4,6-dehydratase [unclassified Synechococcus]MCB4393862.1 NAD-dependent epimerase/dehydratase family protein [Synechococcus sp. PH41509]MCB4421342.1 NAD-dependent epimerase/dehydratase family protein [Synechococcus sp. HB1133]MCB4431307.1 NAD-dependent epimerase/dehydratase family protein [Synechococcus sp. HBA1120]NHI80284.1 NAD-dependent epimerase/dehydratase family protein [Synechococcus sp. HB1133]
MDILITGAAGFIGSRLAMSLIDDGHNVVGLDNYLQQVHGDKVKKNHHFKIVEGDIRDLQLVSELIASYKFSVIFHLAAETGTGQSYDEPTRYADVNILGTTKLFEAIRCADYDPQKIVLAGTRAVYGEGMYVNEAGIQEQACTRKIAVMNNKDFNVYGRTGNKLTAMSTPESLQPAPDSVYASTKLMQEHLIKNLSSNIDWTILRFQNVYGPGQSLRNPYTGVLSIFCSQIKAGKTLEVYEDGEIYRDFIYVDDVVSSLVATVDKASREIINIGSGNSVSMKEVVESILRLAKGKGYSTEYKITGKFREGDIRFAEADINKARDLLQWSPQVGLEQGLSQLVDWSL